jgi:hypothetical protein
MITDPIMNDTDVHYMKTIQAGIDMRDAVEYLFDRHFSTPPGMTTISPRKFFSPAGAAREPCDFTYQTILPKECGILKYEASNYAIASEYINVASFILFYFVTEPDISDNLHQKNLIHSNLFRKLEHDHPKIIALDLIELCRNPIINGGNHNAYAYAYNIVNYFKRMCENERRIDPSSCIYLMRRFSLLDNLMSAIQRESITTSSSEADESGESTDVRLRLQLKRYLTDIQQRKQQAPSDGAAAAAAAAPTESDEVQLQRRRQQSAASREFIESQLRMKKQQYQEKRQQLNDVYSEYMGRQITDKQHQEQQDRAGEILLQQFNLVQEMHQLREQLM